MNKFKSLFCHFKPSVIGMIHVAPLPGSPKFGGSMQKIIDKACEEAEIYKSCNIDSVMIENMHDIPYIKSKDFGPEVVAAMTKICTEVKKILPENLPIGIQILAGGNKESLAVAKVCNLNFIRAEGFVFGHVGDEGYLDACAGSLLRYRKQIDCENILIFTDIKKKHSSHSITADLSIEETSKAAEFFSSDGVIVTGSSTGSPADAEQVNSVKNVVKIPVLVGSGVTTDNIEFYLKADSVIVGSHFKKGGSWEEDLSKPQIIKFMEKLSNLRNS